MHPRILGTASQIIVLALLLGLPESGRAQPSEWAPPLTSDGQPDIQGVWTNFDPTPFEAPSDVDIERLAPLAK